MPAMIAMQPMAFTKSPSANRQGLIKSNPNAHRLGLRPLQQRSVKAHGAFVTELTSEEEFNAFLKEHSSKTVIVDYFTTWCGPCKTVAPLVEGLAEELDGKPIKFAKINIQGLSNAGEFAKRFEIKQVPTFIAFQKENIEGKYIGAKIEGIRKLAFCYI